ncbi:MAG: hypothetical protein V3U88_01535 [Methylococcales bacterium]
MGSILITIANISYATETILPSEVTSRAIESDKELLDELMGIVDEANDIATSTRIQPQHSNWMIG